MTASTYYYDGHGRRVEDIVGGLAKRSQYTQGGQLVMVGDARANTFTEYIYLAGSLLATRERDVPTNVFTTRYHHTDALGTPVVVTGADKSILETRGYEPYGEKVSGPATDGPGYTGHVQDAATGLTYMQQRYYDPLLGRFLSVDPVSAYSNGDCDSLIAIRMPSIILIGLLILMVDAADLYRVHSATSLGLHRFRIRNVIPG